MSERIAVRKEEHPLWPDRITDPDQIVPGMYRRIHCLQETRRDTSSPFSFVATMFDFDRPAMVLDYLVEIKSLPYPDQHGSLRVDASYRGGFESRTHFYLSDAGVIPYGTGDYNESNFLVAAFTLEAKP